MVNSGWLAEEERMRRPHGKAQREKKEFLRGLTGLTGKMRYRMQDARYRMRKEKCEVKNEKCKVQD